MPAMPAMPASESVTSTNAQLAARYACSVRTIQRMRQAGIELFSPEAVAQFILDSQNPPIPILEATLRQLSPTPLEQL